MKTKVVLVVEDDESIRKLISYNLQIRGYEVYSYGYSDISLNILNENMPDIVILDFNIKDGGKAWEFLQIVRMNDDFANVPIMIITTSVDMPSELASYLLTHDIHVIHKPFDIHALIPRIQHVITMASQSHLLFSTDRILPILVVDDSEDLREALATILRLEGYKAETASNGRNALDMLSQSDYCLIVLDMTMPIMGGAEFLQVYDRYLRPHTPVIVLSGDQNIQSLAYPSFVLAAIAKPFNFDVLMVHVKNHAHLAV